MIATPEADHDSAAKAMSRPQQTHRSTREFEPRDMHDARQAHALLAARGLPGGRGA